MMKHLITISAAILLAACGENAPELPGIDNQAPEVEMPNEGDASKTTEGSTKTLGEINVAEVDEGSIEPPPPYNEEVWYISNGWPGEYPPGFSILEDGVSVMGRTAMHDTVVKDISCPLPKSATYQQWNRARGDADELNFISVTEKFEITISEAVEVDAPSDANPQRKLALSPGDVVTYLRYLGEGWALFEYKLEEIDMNEQDLTDVSDVMEAGKAGAPDKLWVEVSCADEARTRAWLLYDEVIKQDSIVATPIIGYGEARDLTEQDRLDAIEQERWNEVAPPADASGD